MFYVNPELSGFFVKIVTAISLNTLANPFQISRYFQKSEIISRVTRFKSFIQMRLRVRINFLKCRLQTSHIATYDRAFECFKYRLHAVACHIRPRVIVNTRLRVSLSFQLSLSSRVPSMNDFPKCNHLKNASMSTHYRSRYFSAIKSE